MWGGFGGRSAAPKVYDIAFATGTDVFASVGADGSVRLFDLRCLPSPLAPRLLLTPLTPMVPLAPFTLFTLSLMA